MAPLKPTFLWRRIGTRSRLVGNRSALVFGTKPGLRDTGNYATIVVKPPEQISAGATPPHRQNHLDVALLTSDCQSETGDYSEPSRDCQAATRSLDGGLFEKEHQAEHRHTEKWPENYLKNRKSNCDAEKQLARGYALQLSIPSNDQVQRLISQLGNQPPKSPNYAAKNEKQ